MRWSSSNTSWSCETTLLRNSLFFITTVKKKETLIHTCVGLGDGPLVSSWPRGREFDSCCHQSFSAVLKNLGVCTLLLRMEWNKITYTVISMEYLPTMSNGLVILILKLSLSLALWQNNLGRSVNVVSIFFSFLDWLTQPQIKESISGITPCRERERRKKEQEKRYRKREWEEKRESHSYHKVSKTLAL